ncbi:ABC transporter permease [Halobacteriales archaeon Cl-PHB]
MSLRSLLTKEVHWSRHNLFALLFVLLLLPGFFAYTSIAFQDVVPRDTPVAVVAGDDDVSDDELTTVKGGMTFFSEPKTVESLGQAREMLHREMVYGVMEVPSGIFDENETNATFVLHVDGSVVPFKEPSKALQGLMASRLDARLPADISVERVVVGNDNSLSEYLVPIFLMGVIMLFAFTYVPYNLARESNALDRIRAESSLETLVTAKLVYFAALMLVPILVFQAAAGILGYAVSAVAIGPILIFLLTFVYLTALSMAIMVVTRFGTFGRFLNVVVLLGLIAFSGLAYPVGYFSPLRKELVRLIPTHYSMIVARSTMLKDVGLGLFTDWLVALVGVTLVTLAALKLSVVYYRRTT